MVPPLNFPNSNKRSTARRVYGSSLSETITKNSLNEPDEEIFNVSDNGVCSHMHSCRFLSTIASVCLAFPFAMSQEVTTNVETDATVVVALGWDNQDQAYPALFEIGVTSRISNILDNGSEIGGRFTVRGSQDNPSRVSGGGQLAILGQSSVPGIHTDVRFSDDKLSTVGPRARIETAYLYIDGGYGELAVGRDVGIVGRFHEGARSIFSHARDSDSLLDPSGLSIIRSRLDWSGNSAKISYATPRLVGVRVGVSYTPSTEADGLDRSVSRSIGDEMSDTWEGGFNYLYTVRRNGSRVRVAVGYASSNIANTLANYATSIDGWTGGFRFEGTRTSLGFSFTSADEGRLQSVLGSDGEDRSEIWTAGIEHSAFGSDFSASFANLERGSDDLSSTSWSAGMRREVTTGFFIGGGVQGRKIEFGTDDLSGWGGILELTQKW